MTGTQLASIMADAAHLIAGMNFAMLRLARAA
jgi:hypothetical protein